MAAAKAMADAAHGIDGSERRDGDDVISCQGFAIRVSGLGDEWFAGPHADVEAKLFEGHTVDDIAWIGGESCITETVGLGGFAQAAAFGAADLPGRIGRRRWSTENIAMYDITRRREHGVQDPVLRLPRHAGRHRRPQGRRDRRPAGDRRGLGGRDGGQIGAGVVRAPMECFTAAVAALDAA